MLRSSKNSTGRELYICQYLSFIFSTSMTSLKTKFGRLTASSLKKFGKESEQSNDVDAERTVFPSFICYGR